MPETNHQPWPSVCTALFVLCIVMLIALPASADERKRPPRIPNEQLPPPVIRKVRGPRKMSNAKSSSEPKRDRSASNDEDLDAPKRPDDGRDEDSSLDAPKRPGNDDGKATPGEVRLKFERPQGVLRYIPADKDVEGSSARIVMIGNPRIERDEHVATTGKEKGKTVPALSVKGRVFVVWVDPKGVPELEVFGGALTDEDEEESEKGGDTSKEDESNVSPSDDKPSNTSDRATNEASVVPEFVLGIYAEGSVEVAFGDQRFRCDRLYLDPKTYRGMLVAPRFDGRILDKEIKKGLPLHLSAKRSLLVARGRMLFEDAELSTSRANDRIALRIRELTVEEFSKALDNDEKPTPHFLGFQSASTQRYRGKQIVLRGEGIDLITVPEFEIGASDASEGLPTLYRRVRAGNRGRLGRWGFVDLGTPIGPKDDPFGDLEGTIGGYTRRGFGLGSTFRWKRLPFAPSLKSGGRVEAFGVYDIEDFDQLGTRSPDFRGRVTSESRTYLHDDLALDLEVHHFSDRGFQREFFERDALEHKDRESYARLQWRPSGDPTTVASFIYKWHQRPFATETTIQPGIDVYTSSLPLLVPSRRGGLGIDVTSDTHAGRLERRFDEDVPLRDHGAWRVSNDTKIHAGLSVGDLRLSGYIGGSADWYRDRNDGGRDLTRGAFLAGTRANLQFHRVWSDAKGTWLELDGLRHIVDLGVGFHGRFADSHDPTDVPFFDRRELSEGRRAIELRARNRFQTRRGGGTPEGGPNLRSLLDLEVGYKYWIDGVGPFGRRSPGAFDLSFSGEPRDGYRIFGEAEFDLSRGLEHAAIATQSHWLWRGKRMDAQLGSRYVRDFSLSLDARLEYRFSPRYSWRFDESYDFIEERNTIRGMLRRYSDDHHFDIGLQVGQGGVVSLQASFEPTLDGRDPVSPLFEDEPALSLDGILPE